MRNITDTELCSVSGGTDSYPLPPVVIPSGSGIPPANPEPTIPGPTIPEPTAGDPTGISNPTDPDGVDAYGRPLIPARS